VTYSWPLPGTDYTANLADPREEYDLWRKYSRASYAAYCKYGVESVLDAEAMATGNDTTLFFAVTDSTGDVVAGSRGRGPLRSADESNSVKEWAGRSNQAEIHQLVDEKIPFGVVEVVTAWAKGGDKVLTDAVARSGFHMMYLLDAKYCVATAHEYVLRQWQSSGGQMPDVDPAPYPDERYTTKLMFWDWDDFAQYAAPGQAEKILAEINHLKNVVGAS
jgi:hypothetical protein